MIDTNETTPLPLVDVLFSSDPVHPPIAPTPGYTPRHQRQRAQPSAPKRLLWWRRPKPIVPEPSEPLNNEDD